MSNYYIVETQCVDSNQDSGADFNAVEIRTAPARENLSGQVRCSGWCGTTNDVATYAHGEYGTLEAARAAIKATFGPARSADLSGFPFESDDPCVVETYRPGAYAPMSRNAAIEWIYDALNRDIAIETTDEELKALASEYEAAANGEGMTLHPSLVDILTEYREELRAEADA